LQESFLLNAGLFENRAQGAFRHVARVVGNGGETLGCRIVPNLVAASGLAVELKPNYFSRLTISR
jgi:hypothetical protein